MSPVWLKRYFAAFGADLRRWPPGRLAGLRRWLGRSRSLSGERADAEALDRALDLWRVEAPGDDLARRIVQRALSLPQQPEGPIRLADDIVVWPFASAWTGIAGFILALFLGCLLGWFGGNPEPQSEDWLSLAALTSIQEDFR
jgi:hypothetical protein